MSIRSELTDHYLSLYWSGERRCLSSAVLNGGFCRAGRILNLRVDGRDCAQAPEETLVDYARAQGWRGRLIGMMTAASMNSVRHRLVEMADETLEVWVSVGLSNARRAGDSADWSADESGPPPGTINTVLATSINLSDAAMAELVTVVTEAKCALLQELGIRSPVSGQLATGTGTDAVVVVAGAGRAERWAGKHTALGEWAARLCMDALRSSILRGDASPVGKV